MNINVIETKINSGICAPYEITVSDQQYINIFKCKYGPDGIDIMPYREYVPKNKNI